METQSMKPGGMLSDGATSMVCYPLDLCYFVDGKYRRRYAEVILLLIKSTLKNC